MIDPIDMSVIEWTDRMSQLLSSITPVKIHREQDWKAWASHVCQSPSISKFNPPNPEQFSDWQEWAERFNTTVRLDD